jgi:uncharacterized protein (TIGR02246 family)
MGTTETSVVSFYEKLAASWKDNDGAEFAAFFAEEGSLINPFGERADGREALAAMYSEYFAGMLKGTTTSIVLTHLRLVGADYAFADAEQSVYGANGEVVLALHAANLLRRNGDDDWQLVDSRPYTFPPRPA